MSSEESFDKLPSVSVTFCEVVTVAGDITDRIRLTSSSRRLQATRLRLEEMEFLRITRPDLAYVPLVLTEARIHREREFSRRVARSRLRTALFGGDNLHRSMNLYPQPVFVSRTYLVTGWYPRRLRWGSSRD
jgi:hypothetical protein